MHPQEMPQMAAQASPQQEITGNVLDIDSRTGLLTLASADGALKLHFPPPSLSSVKKGDQITVQFAYTKGRAGGERAYDAPKGLGEHRMTGTVTGVDHAKGWVQLQTDAGLLALPFPPRTVRDLKSGDQITIDLAFSKGGKA